MNKLLILLAIGTVAALIDTAPMLLRKTPWVQIATPFTHWIAAAILIGYSTMPLPNWAKGLAIGVITTISFLFVLAQSHPNAVPVVAAISVALGTALGVVIPLVLARFSV